MHALQTVLADELAVIAFTEEELVWQANQKLPLEERITYRTFQRYKALVMSAETGDEIPPTDIPSGIAGEAPAQAEAPETEQDNTELVREMYTTIKGALFQQKLAMVKGVYAQLPNWRRYCWLLERKFPDFRLKQPTAPKTLQTEALQHTTKPATVIQPTPPAPTAKLEVATTKPKAPAEVLAKVANDKPADPVPQPASKPLTVEEKWAQRTYLPWKPMPLGTEADFNVKAMYALDKELKADIAAGYVNPYAHFEYRPDVVEYVHGFYRCFGMGEDKLPLRVHILNQSEAPEPEQWEALWHEQERKRNNIIRREQGLPTIPPPTETNTPLRRGIILGHSG